MYNNKNFKNQKEKKPKVFAPERLYSYGLWLLSRRDYTAHEITEKMKKYQPEIDIIEKTISRLVEQGYINDERRATNLINSYIKKESSYKIKRRLSEKGISKEIIEEAILNNVDKDAEIENAKQMILKKFKSYNQDMYQKYASYLAGRGYNWDIISKAIDFLKNNTEE